MKRLILVAIGTKSSISQVLPRHMKEFIQMNSHILANTVTKHLRHLIVSRTMKEFMHVKSHFSVDIVANGMT